MAKNLTWEQAIDQVLGEAARPLHYTDISDRILQLGLREKTGATPSNSVSTALNISINSGANKYVRLGDGMYALRNWVDQPKSALEIAPEIAASGDEADTGAINAFGMFWLRNEIDWERPQILGRQEGAELTVNFNEQIGVYLLHDRDRVIYVGRAEDALVKRLSAHTAGRFGGRWDRFSWFGLRAVENDGTLRAGEDQWTRGDVIQTMEAVLIECLEPAQNRRRGDKLGEHEFLQVRDPGFRRAEARRLLDQLLSAQF